MGKNQTSFKNNNKKALKHGADGALRRIRNDLPLAEDDKRLHSEIVSQLGYNADELPKMGVVGFIVDLVADNILLAHRFKGARHWAADQNNVNAYASLAQKSGWRNDKAIAQLLELARLQAEGDNVIQLAIDSIRSEDDNHTD